MICDMPMADDGESDEDELIAQGWAVASHIVDLHNASLDSEVIVSKITDDEILVAFGNSNFGPRQQTPEGRRELICEALGKFARGFGSGSFMTAICFELKLITSSGMRDQEFPLLTSVGLDFLLKHHREVTNVQ